VLMRISLFSSTEIPESEIAELEVPLEIHQVLFEERRALG